MKQVINILKQKSNQEIEDVADHNLRKTHSRNVVKNKKHLNKFFIGNYKTEVLKEMSKRLETVPKFRKDAVKIVNLVFSASPEFFQNATKAEVEKWEKLTQKYVEDTFGKENIIYSVVHYDETTPHFHICLTPIFEGKLRASHWFDGPAKLKKFHTDYSKVIAELGIKRGEKFVKSSNNELREYYKKVNASTKYERYIDNKVEDLFKKFDNPTFSQKLNPWAFLSKVVKPLVSQLSSNLSHYRTRSNELRELQKEKEFLVKRIIDLELKLETLGLSKTTPFLELEKIKKQFDLLPKASPTGATLEEKMSRVEQVPTLTTSKNTTYKPR